MENAPIFAVPFGKRLRRKLLNGEQKESSLTGWIEHIIWI